MPPFALIMSAFPRAARATNSLYPSAAAGYDPLYGARPGKRTIQRYIVNELSKRILAGDVNREKPIKIGDVYKRQCPSRRL